MITAASLPQILNNYLNSEWDLWRRQAGGSIDVPKMIDTGQDFACQMLCQVGPPTLFNPL